MGTKKTFTAIISAQVQTPAKTIAQLLAPGQWSSELTPAAYPANGTINQQIGYKGTLTPAVHRAFETSNAGTGVYGLLSGWAGKAFADDGDPLNPRWWYLAGITGGDPYSQTAVRYDSATDRFLHWQGSGIGATDGIFHPWGAPHNFGSAAFDPASRRLFRICKGVGNPPGYGSAIGWLNVDNPSSSGSFPGLANTFGSAAWPTCEFVAGWGTQGSLAIFLNADSNYNKVFRYDIALNQVFDEIPGTRYSPTAPCLSAHSGVVYFSFGDGLVHRLNANKTVTTLPSQSSTPILMCGGGTGTPNFCVWSVFGGYIYAFCDNNAVYRFNVATETWSSVLAQMPARPQIQYFYQNYTAAPLTAYGVFLVVDVVDGYTVRALLWKPPA